MTVCLMQILGINSSNGTNILWWENLEINNEETFISNKYGFLHIVINWGLKRHLRTRVERYFVSGSFAV